jgi:hypothetical protein
LSKVVKVNGIRYIPIATTLFGVYFLKLLYVHWSRNREAKHILWWMIGVFCYLAGTITESINTLIGFSIINFKTWYISGALLGGAPLAQGTVYLLCKKPLANLLSVLLVIVLLATTLLVIFSPVNSQSVVSGKLNGKVLTWSFIRAITPFINSYAFAFLVGGAIYSAIKYAKNKAYKKRLYGNLLIALGGLLPGIGGTYTRFGYIEVLYVTEFIGLIFIYSGYITIRNDGSKSIYVNQLTVISQSP